MRPFSHSLFQSLTLYSQLKPHGAIYGQTARDARLARAAVSVAHVFGVAFVGLAGTEHQRAAEDAGVPFIAEWFADLEYSPEGKLLITKHHKPVTHESVQQRVCSTVSIIYRPVTGTLPAELSSGSRA